MLLQLLAAQEKPTLAVLELEGFGISGPEIQTLTNRLQTNLIQLGVYRIIERGLMLQILQEQDFQMTGCTSDECAVEVGQLLGAQLMLAGSIGRAGNTWTVEMRIIDVETGAVTKSASYDTRGEMALVLAVFYFLAAVLDTHHKLSEWIPSGKVMAGSVLDSAKRVFRVPDFKYYALGDGLSAIFRRNPGKLRLKPVKHPVWQISLNFI